MKRVFVGLCAFALMIIGAPVTMAADSINIELNKFEDREDACRAYLVFENNTDTTFTEFKLDLVMFNPDGIIARRLALDAAPLRADKTSVKLFDIGGLACADIGRILINDVMGCRDSGGERTDCIGLVTPTSRNSVPFIK